MKAPGTGIIAFILHLAAALLPCSAAQGINATALQKELTEYIDDKDAKIGVAVIHDSQEMAAAVNADKPFPMLSVYKFPIAIALREQLTQRGESLSDTIIIYPNDLKPDTYSPMRDRFGGKDTLALPIREVLAYALQQSDNNASDILLKKLGGPENVMSVLKRLGVRDINVVSTEDEMHLDSLLCYHNSATPEAMARLLDEFDREYNDSISTEIKALMESCRTGTNRLAKPLQNGNATLGHKTGTGFVLPRGRLMAINDVGYVHLPDGTRYAIAVFIADSGYDIVRTEEIIAEISKIVLRAYRP